LLNLLGYLDVFKTSGIIVHPFCISSRVFFNCCIFATFLIFLEGVAFYTTDLFHKQFVKDLVLVGLWCLTPLSTIYQPLYRGDQI